MAPQQQAQHEADRRAANEHRLIVDGVAVAPVTIAASAETRRRGLLGSRDVDGAMLLPRVSAVHTIGMRYPIDVAYLNQQGLVLDVHRMARYRLGRPRARAAAVLEAMAGAFDEWGIVRGAIVTTNDDDNE